MNYRQLSDEYHASNKIPYGKLLLTDEWKSKRNKILERDDYTCTACNSSESRWVENYHIYFNFTERIFEQSVIAQFNVAEFKEKFNIRLIDIRKLSNKGSKNLIFGMSDNEILFGCLAFDDDDQLELNAPKIKVFITTVSAQPTPSCA